MFSPLRLCSRDSGVDDCFELLGPRCCLRQERMRVPSQGEAGYGNTDGLIGCGVMVRH